MICDSLYVKVVASRSEPVTLTGRPSSYRAFLHRFTCLSSADERVVRMTVFETMCVKPYVQDGALFPVTPDLPHLGEKDVALLNMHVKLNRILRCDALAACCLSSSNCVHASPGFLQSCGTWYLVDPFNNFCCANSRGSAFRCEGLTSRASDYRHSATG
jgi:hypothetical protein